MMLFKKIANNWEFSDSVLNTLMDITPEGLLVVDNNSQIEMCNEAFCTYFSTTKSKVIGNLISYVIPDISIKNVLITGEPIWAETIIINDARVGFSIYPVSEGKTISRVIVKLIFEYSQETDITPNKLNALKSKLAFYKDRLDKVLGERFNIGNIVGKSQAILDLKETIKRMASGHSTVLLRGESGTGKNLFGHVIHMESNRKFGPFVNVSCNAVPENLLEAELFGYIEGAFSGANKGGQIGKFELANRGTIFLYEIGDMSLNLQGKLLKVIQNSEIQRIGEDKTLPVDVRIITATNRNLEDLCRRGLFREDLYCRLNVLSLNIPPLKDRLEDIEPLINFFIDKYNSDFGKKVIGISSEAYNIFIGHLWPGNVKELESVLERVFRVIEDQIIQPNHLPLYLRKSPNTPIKMGDKMTLKLILDDTEKSIIIQTLQRTGGNKVKAAKVLGISRAGLYQKLEKHSLLDE